MWGADREIAEFLPNYRNYLRCYPSARGSLSPNFLILSKLKTADHHYPGLPGVTFHTYLLKNWTFVLNCIFLDIIEVHRFWDDWMIQLEMIIWSNKGQNLQFWGSDYNNLMVKLNQNHCGIKSSVIQWLFYDNIILQSQFHFPFKFLFFVCFSLSSVSLCFGQAQILSWSSLTIFPFH